MDNDDDGDGEFFFALISRRRVACTLLRVGSLKWGFHQLESMKSIILTIWKYSTLYICILQVLSSLQKNDRAMSIPSFVRTYKPTDIYNRYLHAGRAPVNMYALEYKYISLAALPRSNYFSFFFFFSLCFKTTYEYLWVVIVERRGQFWKISR